MRITIIGMALGLVLITTIACSCDSNSLAESNALSTSVPPAARATQPAIAPDLQESANIEDVSGGGNPKQGGVFNTLWSDPPTLDPHLVTDGTS